MNRRNPETSFYQRSEICLFLPVKWGKGEYLDIKNKEYCLRSVHLSFHVRAQLQCYEGAWLRSGQVRVAFKSAIGLVQICRVTMATQDGLRKRPPAAEDHAYFQLACCDGSL